MSRVKRGSIARKRRNKIFNVTEGSRGAQSLLIRTAIQGRMKALASSHRDRVKRKRDFRKLWITRINAACRQYGMNYSRFMYLIYEYQSFLNRKMIAQLAILDPKSFHLIIKMILANYNSTLVYCK